MTNAFWAPADHEFVLAHAFRDMSQTDIALALHRLPQTLSTHIQRWPTYWPCPEHSNRNRRFRTDCPACTGLLDEWVGRVREHLERYHQTYSFSIDTGIARFIRENLGAGLGPVGIADRTGIALTRVYQIIKKMGGRYHCLFHNFGHQVCPGCLAYLAAWREAADRYIAAREAPLPEVRREDLPQAHIDPARTATRHRREVRDALAALVAVDPAAFQPAADFVAGADCVGVGFVPIFFYCVRPFLEDFFRRLDPAVDAFPAAALRVYFDHPAVRLRQSAAQQKVLTAYKREVNDQYCPLPPRTSLCLHETLGLLALYPGLDAWAALAALSAVYDAHNLLRPGHAGALVLVGQRLGDLPRRFTQENIAAAFGLTSVTLRSRIRETPRPAESPACQGFLALIAGL